MSATSLDTIAAIISYLNTHANETVDGHAALGRAIGRAATTIRLYARDASLATYRYDRTLRHVIWGHPDALASIKDPDQGSGEPTNEDLLGEQVEALRATQRRLESDNRKLRVRLASRDELARQVAGAVERLPAPARTSARTRSKKPAATLLLALSDWHIGEVVRPSEMGGTNAYDWNTAREGMADITRRILRWVEIQRQGYSIEHAHVLVLGDVIGGGIHDELAAHAEFPAPVAAAKAGALLAETLASLSTDLRLTATCIAGNHDRLSHTTPYKRTNEDSLSHLTYVIAREALTLHKHVTVNLPDDPLPSIEVHGRRIAAMHGHAVKASGVSPYYGIARRASALSRERTERNQRPHDHLIIGHFHHHACLDDCGVILVPSLIGPTEWSRQMGFRGAPGQWACLVGEHGLHGMTVFERRPGTGVGRGL